MCGIFGCIGRQGLVAQTLTSLKILEYRGYDSAGIAYASAPKQPLTVVKAVGEISQLVAKVATPPPAVLCLGHTRWATNGKVCLANSHPHLSADGTIAVVHNGIIENYQACCELLRQQQITLQTDVDTEVIPNILCMLRNNKHNIHQYLQGQYVFCAGMTTPEPTLFLAKKGSLPLYIGRNADNIYVTSDTLAFPPDVTQIITLDHLDTCAITAEKIDFYHQGQPVAKTWQPFTVSYTASDKQGYTTFMAKEIHEIPVCLQRIITQYQQEPQLSALHQGQALLQTATCVHVCGCGTSYHAALIIAALIEQNTQHRAKAHISSEFTAATILHPQDIAIVISQSGETADTLACMQILQAHHVPIIAFCNVTTSTIAQQSTICLPLLCGPEIAVASTKVFCASLLVGCLLVNYGTTAQYQALPALATDILAAAPQLIPLPTTLPNKIFFIGKGYNYFLAQEAALKVKEVTYLHCEGYPANELKHGPLSLVDQQTLAIVYAQDSANAIAEIQARGGTVLTLPAPADTNPLAFIAQIIPAQVFALNLATSLHINPDKPRNLAKSVTVL